MKQLVNHKTGAPPIYPDGAATKIISIRVTENQFELIRNSLTGHEMREILIALAHKKQNEA